MQKQYDVTALGELLIDFTENGVSEQGNALLEANPGGAPCNVLAMLQKLGKRTAFIGKVGKDQFGRLLKETIESAGIDSRNLVMDEEVNTTLAFVHTDKDGDRDFSFRNLTLMINGLPMIHIELKNRQHSYMDAFRQIKKYISEGKFTGIFSAVQMFVVSNGVDTKYFAAASDTELNPKFMSGWVDAENNPVSDYIDFAKSVLCIPKV